MITANIYQDTVFNPDKPLIKVLLETDFTKEIRIAMHRGTLMKEHKTAFPIVVEIVEGSIDFDVQGTSHPLKKGDLIALEGGVPHSLKAGENSIIRLTLTKDDRTNRVAKVVEK
jgi:quercetin dioxygenase-like cupin family protein